MASQINEITEEKRGRLNSQSQLSVQQQSRLDSGCSDGEDAAGGDERKGQGRWTKEEHKKFIEGIKMYGRNWKLVEEHIGSRTGAQIRSHAQKFFNRIEKEQQSTSTFSQASNQLLQIMQAPPMKLTRTHSQTNKSSSEKIPGAVITVEGRSVILDQPSIPLAEREMDVLKQEKQLENPVQLQQNGNSVRISLKFPSQQQPQQQQLSPLAKQQYELAQQQYQQQQLLAISQQQQQVPIKQQQQLQQLSAPPAYPSEIIPGSSMYPSERQRQLLFSEGQQQLQQQQEAKRYFLEPRQQSLEQFKVNRYANPDPRMFESTALMYKEVEDMAYENAVAAIGTSNNNRNLHLLNNNSDILSHQMQRQQQQQLYGNPIFGSSNNNSNNPLNANGIQYKNIYEKQQLTEQQQLQQQQQQQILQQQQLLQQQQQQQQVHNAFVQPSSSSPVLNPISPYSQPVQPAQNNTFEDSDEVVDKYLRQIQENSVHDNSYFIEHHLADITEPRLYEMCALGQADQSLNFKSEVYVPNQRGQHKGRSRFGSFKLHDEENEISNMKYQNLRKASTDDQELKKKLKLNDGGYSSLSSSQFQLQAQQQQQQQQQQPLFQLSQQQAENISGNNSSKLSPISSAIL